MTSSSIFSLSKRDFLHQKLDELLRVWARASGQGNFYLTVADGSPDFQFAIQLDFDDASAPEANFHPHNHPQHHVRKPRGPAQQAKNRKRAADYQAAKAAAARHRAATAEPAVILPFTGNLLPLKKPSPHHSKNGPAEPAADDTNASKAPYEADGTAHSVAASSAPSKTDVSAELSAASTASSPPSTATGPPPASRPTKSSQPNQAASHVNSVKKKLFSAPQKTVKKKCYQIKEDDLWTKLFQV